MYNTARVLEQPIAPFEFVDANQQGGGRTADGSENEDLDTTRESFEFVEVNEQSGGGSNAVSTEHGDTESTESEGLSTTFFDSNAQNGSSQLDEKPVVEDDDALSAYGHLFNENEFEPELDNNTSFTEGIHIESTPVSGEIRDDQSNEIVPLEEAHNENSVNQEIEKNVQLVLKYGVKVVIDADVEYLHIPSQVLKPKEPTYDVKANDILCGNIPFKELVFVFPYKYDFEFFQSQKKYLCYLFVFS